MRVRTMLLLAWSCAWLGLVQGCEAGPAPAATRAGGPAAGGGQGVAGSPETGPHGGSVGPAGAAAADPVAPDAGAPTLDEPSVEEAQASGGVGFQLRDATPYPRLGAPAVLDTEHDRMIVYGGGGNDVWILPLSGPDAERWRILPVRGDHPPAHIVRSLIGPFDSAVYDPVRRSMILAVTRVATGTSPDGHSEVWELSLEDTPRWHELAQLDSPEGLELQGARVVLDASAHRLLLFGGSQGHTGLWSLSLDDEPSFSRLASGPDASTGAFFGPHSLALDAARDRVLLFGALPRDPTVWAFDLAEGRWQSLGVGGSAASSYGVATVLDAARDRLVVLGGDEQYGVVATFDLETNTWVDHPSAHSDAWSSPSAVLDAERGRILAFGGLSDLPLGETWALSLSDLEWSQLGAPSAEALPNDGERSSVYDPVRDAIVSFGSLYDSGSYARALHGSGGFRPLPALDTPMVSWPAVIYDSVDEAIVTFGGYAIEESSQLSILRSAPADGDWRALDAGDGPGARSRHVMVYDREGQRAIVFAGWRNSSYPPAERFSDVWTLALGAENAWSVLRPSGDPPGEGEGYVGVFDDAGRRLVVFRGGITSTLSLGDDPRWQRVEARGTPPIPADTSSVSALYDALGQRMLLFEVATDGTRVSALDLGDTPTWHAFCPDTIVPALAGSASAELVPDGVFLAVGDAAWRFDLSTPYCE